MIRNTAKAVIEHENKLLFIKKQLDNEGIYYTLPGGGQEASETMEATMIRECKEELDALAKIEELICVREYVSGNHEYSFLVKQVHALEFVFRCSFETYDNMMHLQNDVAQVGFQWLDISEVIESIKGNDEIHTLKFPRTLKDFLKEYLIERRVKSYSLFVF